MAIWGCGRAFGLVARAIIFADVGKLELLFTQKTQKNHRLMPNYAVICPFCGQKDMLKVILNYRSAIFLVRV